MRIVRLLTRFFFLTALGVCIVLPPVSGQSRDIPEEGGEFSLVIGTAFGLAGIRADGATETLWEGGEVRKVFCTERAEGREWLMLTTAGIFVSRDLFSWEKRDAGLPRRVLKTFLNGETGFVTVPEEIKDLEIDPQNPLTIVLAVKNAVYFTRDGGISWRNAGMPASRTNGIKAVAITAIAGELTIFCSHSIYGLHYFRPDRGGASWEECNTGLETLETTENPDEISDIAVYMKDGAPEILVSQTFRPRIYRMDFPGKKCDLIWRGEASGGSVDSLEVSGNTLRFLLDTEVMELSLPASGTAPLERARERRDVRDLINTIPENLDMTPLCAAFLEKRGREVSFSTLSELWLLLAGKQDPAQKSGADREGIYLPVNHATDSYSLAPYLELIETRDLNMVVVDMKDDYGRLRFTPDNAALTEWGRVFWPVDLEAFLSQMKEKGVYTVARVVVWKDPEAVLKEGGRYAVWDRVNNKPWAGYYDTERKKPEAVPGETPRKELPANTETLPGTAPDTEIIRTYYDERWVDPYAEDYWEYIASLSEELCERGFDEIQYDYIRFPTDGINLGDASYRWRSSGMDMDSAVISFLRHVRNRVKAPISVDIYGANGWYRTGSRTGQEAELLAPWVDIICPMYYPSHFEQDFLAHDPEEERPFRIYHDGTARTSRITREKVIVRPWVQAFYLNVSYDRRYYDSGYVRREIEGVRAAGNGGFTYWNNSGRYDDIPFPDTVPGP